MKNDLFWLKINAMSGEGEGEGGDGGGDDGSMLPAGGGSGDGAGDGGDGGNGGDGDDQSWFLKDKYKSVEDQAKAYPELQKKLGETADLVGAPEDGSYELSMPEGVEGEFIKDDPMLKGFQEVAKELNLSQGAFDKILHGYLQGEFDAQGASKEEEMKAIGDNAERRLQALADWGQANMDTDTYEAFRGLASTADGVKVLEALVSKTLGHKIPTGDDGAGAGTNGMTEAKLREMSNKKDENGNLLRSIDPKYNAEVRKAYRDFHGDQPHNQVIG